VDFVRCRICDDHRRVISGRHLSKHETDRETYMEEYELSPDELIAKDVRRLQSSRPGYQAYGEREWIQAVKNLHKRERHVFAGRVHKRHPHIYIQGIWLFCDWNNALRAAGFDPEKTRRRRSWDKQSVIRKICALRQGNVPLSAEYAMKNHNSLFAAALRGYGTWAQALIAAGVINKEIPRKTRLGLLRDLRDLMERSTAGIPEPLKLYLTYYFGSVRNAIAALKTDRKLLSGWSKSKITATLAQMHRSREKLGYSTIRRHSPALLSAAEAYFGSWGKALHAAGIDPNLYFVYHKWRVRP
jgi:hypothetical protein